MDIRFVWMDGELLPYEKAKVPVLSHTLHYGSGAFEGIRAYSNGKGTTHVFRAREHFQRFFDSTRTLGLRLGYTMEDYIEATRSVIKANELEECYVRPLAYIDDSVRGLKLPPEVDARSAIIVWGWGKYMGDAGQANGIRVRVSTYRRADLATGLPWAKLTGGYLTGVLSRREASLSGMDEAILLDQQGYVAEGSGENLFLVTGKTLLTPPPHSILPGITRDSAIQLARSLGYEVREVPLTRNQLYRADELFFTGTAVEITGIREVDGQTIGKGSLGPITKQLMDIFFKTVRGEVPEFQGWLTKV